MTAPEQLVTDGGLETDLIFHQGSTCRTFAAFPLLDATTGAACCATTTTVHGDRRAVRRRPRPGDADLAGQPRLGRAGSATTRPRSTG